MAPPCLHKNYYVCPDMRCDVRHVIAIKSRVEVTHKLVPEENSLCVRQLKGVTYI